MKKFFIKSLSVILSLLIALTSLPLASYAEGIGDIYESLTNDDNESKPETRSAEDVHELVELRDKNVKQFKQEDGTIVAAQYNSPVHYLDENGIWQDIDNTLIESPKDYSTNDAKIKFSKKVSGNENLFTLHDANHKITMSLNGAKKKTEGVVTNTVTEFAPDETELQKLMTLDKLSSTIIYRNILTDTDLEYIVHSCNVKENIIVKSPKSDYTYTFTIKLNNLEALLAENGDVNIFDPITNKTVYAIPRGFMYDNNGEISDLVHFALENKGLGEYSFTVNADAEWINNENRAFPVTIDPSFNIPDTSTVTDIAIHSTSTNKYTGSMLYVSNTITAYWKTSALPELPASAYITNASITLHPIEPNDNMISVHRVTTDWDSALTGNSANSSPYPGSVESSVQDYVYVSTDNLNNIIWDITALVKNWYAETVANYGVAFKIMSDTESSTFSSFHSTDSVAVCRPQFTVSYKDMKGLESYWSYTSQSVGLAGTGYVNNVTGNLVFTKPLLSTTDSLMPYTPTLVFNSELAKTRYIYPNAQTSYWGSYMPYGFKMSMNETLIKKTYGTSDETNGYYVWTDSDGTEHYFIYENTENNKKIYRDEDGLQLKLAVSSTACTITDDRKTVKTFIKLPRNAGDDVSEGWYLTSISDAHNNVVSFTFDGGKRPTSINFTPNGSTTIPSLKICYNSDTFPSVIYNEASKEAIVFQYSASPTGSIAYSNTVYLRELIYAHGTDSVTEEDWLSFYQTGSNSKITVDGKATYLYDSNGHLVKAKDELKGYEVRYTYSGHKVTSVREYANGVESGQQIGFSYYTSYAAYTEVRNSGSDDIYGNSDDIITVYTYDREGRAVSTYSTNSERTKIYGASSGEYVDDGVNKNNIKTTASIGGTSSNYLLNGGFEKGSVGNASPWIPSSNVSFAAENKSYAGKRCAYFELQSNESAQLSQCVQLQDGKYTLSMQVNSFNCKNVAVTVTVQSLDDSARVFTENIPVNEFCAAREYSTFSMDLETGFPSTVGERFKITVKAISGIVATGEAAELCIDNVTLDRAVGPIEYNMVEMGSFEKTTLNSSGTYEEKFLDYWEVSDGNTVHRATVEDPFNSCGYYYANAFTENFIMQRIYESSYTSLPAQTKTYKLSAFAKSDRVSFSKNASFCIFVDIMYHDDDGRLYLDSKRFDFRRDCIGWQFISGTFETNYGEYSNYILDTIDIYCDYSYQPYNATVFFDEISVIEVTDESVVRYEYYGEELDGDKRAKNTRLEGLLRRKQLGHYSEIYEYNDQRMITRKANTDGEIYDYIYASNGIDVDTVNYYKFTYYGSDFYPYLAASPDSAINKIPKTATKYEYNNYGLTESTSTYEIEYSSSNVLRKKSNTKYITSTSEYNTVSGSRIFGALTKQTDTLGRSTCYFYRPNTGRLTAVLDPDEKNGTCYSYDAIGNITSVMPARYVSSTQNYTVVSNAESVTYGYNTHNLLESITTESTEYTFTYDLFGNSETISAGNRELASYEYYENNGKLKKITYGNGFYVKYVYDELENIKEIWYSKANGTEYKTYVYTYTSGGQLHRIDNLSENISTVYKYDTSGKLLESTQYDSEDMINKFSKSFMYDDRGRVQSMYNTFDYSTPAGLYDCQVSYTYSYESDSRLNSYRIVAPGKTLDTNYSYDTWDRISSISAASSGFNHTVNYTYSQITDGSSNTHTSSQIASYSSKVNSNSALTYTYEYDNNGNITKITRGGMEFRYVYDDLGQLIREDNPDLNKTITYAYDNAGNITLVTEYALTAADITPSNALSFPGLYTYGDSSWGDLLTMFNGYPITYDEIGNPTVYTLPNCYSAQLLWSHGRQLSAVNMGGTWYYYGYNDEGVRVYKNGGAYYHNYTVDGTRVITDSWGDNILVYLYDADGAPLGMQYRNVGMIEDQFYTYWFEKNLQGDIVAIYNASGVKVITYTYDAWGLQTRTVLNSSGTNSYAQYNCLTYRGYFYDQETGLYYLNSRYYNPVTKRFINADGYISTGQGLLGNNMFAYCGNNPVSRTDPSGDFWITATVLTVLLVGCLALTGCSQTPDVDPNPLPYNSADDAATAFSEEVYSASMYVQHEYVTEIYARTYGDMVTYGYNTPRSGTVHEAVVIPTVPEGTTLVAYAHTHPYPYSEATHFSDEDIFVAKKYRVNAYFVDYTALLFRYNVISNSTTTLHTICPVDLTSSQRVALENKFRDSWNFHLANIKTCNCKAITWPYQ